MPSMARMPTRDTAPELALRSALRRLRTGPVIANDSSLPGSPDAVLPAHKVALFAHGCFWHHHAVCRCGRLPQQATYWRRKFRKNKARDIRNRDDLLKAGWKVAWVWECAVVGRKAMAEASLDATLQGLIRGQSQFVEISGPAA